MFPYCFSLQNVFSASRWIMIFLLPLPLDAQIDSLAEEMMNEDDEQGYFVEWLEILANDPLDINNASEKMMTELPFLSTSQIDIILRNRPFSRKSEIAGLLGGPTYERIKSFIILKKVEHFPRVIFTQRFQQVIEKTKAFEERKFNGTPFESMSRLHIKISPSISAGLLIQKDIGELRFDDHLSGFVSWNPTSYPLKIIAGNFYIHCAEGLILSSSYLFSERALIRQPAHNTYSRLKPCLSSSENGGFRGAALQWTLLTGIELTAFYSVNKVDAVLSEDTHQILHFERSGYHRNEKESNTVNRAREKSVGFVVAVPIIRTAAVGLSYVSSDFHPAFSILDDSEQKQREYFRFEGSRIENFSVFYSFQHRLFLMKGEVASSGNKFPAQMHSLYVGQTHSYLFLRFSSYPPGFCSATGRSSSGSNPSAHGSQVFFIGYSEKPLDLLDLNVLYSIRKDLWRTYFNPMPLFHKSIELNVSLNLNHKTRFLCKYTIKDEGQFHGDKRVHRMVRKGRFQIEKKIGSYVQIRSRVEKNDIRYDYLIPHKSGFNFYQDIRIKTSKILSLSLRFSSFQSEDYDSRIYEFESGVSGLFSNYPLYGSGNKFYITLSLTPLPGLKFWLKYRQIYFDGADIVGSGLNTIEGPMRQDFYCQLEYRY